MLAGAAEKCANSPARSARAGCPARRRAAGAKSLGKRRPRDSRRRASLPRDVAAAASIARQIWPPGAGCSSTTSTSRPSGCAATAAAMPAGPAPTISRSQRSVMPDLPLAVLALDAHAVAHWRETGLDRAHAIDPGEAVEAHTHHAVGRAPALPLTGVVRDHRRSLPQQHGRDGFAGLGGDGAPSMVIVTALLARPCSFRNIETPLVEHGRGICRQRTGNTPSAMRTACTAASVTPEWHSHDEGAGMRLRLRVDRIAVGRHDAQAGPVAHQPSRSARFGTMRRRVRHTVRRRACRGRGVEADLFVAWRRSCTVPSPVWRKPLAGSGSIGASRSVTRICPRCGRSGTPMNWRPADRAETGGDDDARRRKSLVLAESDGEASLAGQILVHLRARAQRAAERRKPPCSPASSGSGLTWPSRGQSSRPRPPAPSGTPGTSCSSSFRSSISQSGSRGADLIAQPLQVRPPLSNSASPRQNGRPPCARTAYRSRFSRRAQRRSPARDRRCAGSTPDRPAGRALALQPDEAEIGARRAQFAVAAVEHRDAWPFRARP